MVRLGEHVEGLDGLEGVAALAEHRRVAGQRGRLAGDVDDPLQCWRDQRVQDRPFSISPLGILSQCGTRRLDAGGDDDGGRCTFA
jgi:hypothetical protein